MDYYYGKIKEKEDTTRTFCLISGLESCRLITSFPFSSWFKESHHHLLNPLPGDPRYKHITGAVIIKDVNTSDAGNYRYRAI